MSNGIVQEWKESSNNWTEEDTAMLNNAIAQRETIESIYEKFNGRHSKDAIQLRMIGSSYNNSSSEEIQLLKLFTPETENGKKVYSTLEILQHVYEPLNISKLETKEFARIYSRLQRILKMMNIQGKRTIATTNNKKSTVIMYTLFPQEIDDIRENVKNKYTLSIDYMDKVSENKHTEADTKVKEELSFELNDSSFEGFDDEYKKNLQQIENLKKELESIGAKSMDEVRSMMQFFDKARLKEYDADYQNFSDVQTFKLFKYITNHIPSNDIKNFNDCEEIKWGIFKDASFRSLFLDHKEYFDWLLKSCILNVYKLLVTRHRNS